MRLRLALAVVLGLTSVSALGQVNLEGFSGLVHTTSAAIPEAQRLTLSLQGEGFQQSDLLTPRSTLERFQGIGTASYTPFRFLEAAVSWTAYQSSFQDLTNPLATPEVSNVVGDVGLGVRGSFWLSDGLTVGALVRAVLPAGHKVSGPDTSAVSGGGSLLGTADLRSMPVAWPLKLHLNMGLWGDRTESLLTTAEAQDLLPYEKYVLGIRGDSTLDLGLAAEWLPTPSWTPFLELWTRQARRYASYARTDPSFGSVGFAQNPIWVTPGVRWSPLAPLSVELAVELSASGRITDRSGQPVEIGPRWNAVLGVSYAVLPGQATVKPPEAPHGYLLHETPPRLLLVLNSGAKGRRALSVFDLDTLKEVEGSPFDLSIPAERGVLDPVAHRLYLIAPSAQEGDPGLAVFDTRLLKEVSGSPWKVGGAPFGITLDRAQGRLYVSLNQKGAGNLRVWEAEPPKEVARLTTSAVGGQVTLDPSGHRLILSQASIPGRPGADQGNAVAVFDTDTLTEQRVPAGAGAWSLAVDAGSGTLFVGNRIEGTVRAYALKDLIELPGSPYPLGVSGADPIALAVDPSTHRLLAANFASNGDKALFAWDLAGGGLQPAAGSPFPAGPAPIAIGLDADDRRVFVADCACRQGSTGNWVVTVHREDNLEPSGPGVLQAGPAPSALFVQP